MQFSYILLLTCLWMLIVIGGTSGSVLFHPEVAAFWSSLLSLQPLSWFFCFSSIFEALPVYWITNLLLHPSLLIILLSDDLCNPCCFWRKMILCFIIPGCVTLEVVTVNFYPSQAQAPSWSSNHLQCLDTMGCLHHAHIDQQRAETARKTISVSVKASCCLNLI